MSKISNRLAVIRDNVGKIIDVSKRAEELPEKQVEGKFVVINFPIIKRGIIDAKGNVIPQSEEVIPDQ